MRLLTSRLLLRDLVEANRAAFVTYQMGARYRGLYDLDEGDRFRDLGLHTIIRDTASGNKRVERLARWFGAEIAARRDGPDWMATRGWSEVDWALTRDAWARSGRRLSLGSR